MRRKKRSQELTIKDNFMFGAVMSDEDMCRGCWRSCLAFPLSGWRLAKSTV
ncbi:MAG: hypothetical protein HFH01_03510 [Dorea sp.]|nr:hypothetical protein [Dorea sp.]